MANAQATWTGDAPFIVSRGGVKREMVYRHPEESKARNVPRVVTVYYCVACAVSNGAQHQMEGDEELAAHLAQHEGHVPTNAPHAAPSTQPPAKDPTEGQYAPAPHDDAALSASLSDPQPGTASGNASAPAASSPPKK